MMIAHVYEALFTFFEKHIVESNGFAGGSHRQSSCPDSWKKRPLATRGTRFPRPFPILLSFKAHSWNVDSILGTALLLRLRALARVMARRVKVIRSGS